MNGRGLLRFYARELRRVLRRPTRAAAFASAIVLHAAGHAAVALAGAGVVVAVVGASGLGSAGSSSVVAGPSVVERAFRLAVVGLCAVGVKVVAGVYASYVQARVAAEVGAALRLAVLDRLLGAHRVRRTRHGDHGAEVRARSHADDVSAMTADVLAVEHGLAAGVLGGARALAQLVALVSVLVALAPKLALVALAVFVPLSALLGAARKRYKRASARASREASALLEASDEAARHAELWVTYGAEHKVRANVTAIGDAVGARGARLVAGAAAMSGANEVLGAAAVVCAIAAARAGWLGAVGSGAAMLGFAVTFFLAYRPLRDLAEARLALARASAAHDDLDRARATDDVASTIAPRAWPLGDLEVRELVLPRGAAPPIAFVARAGSIVAISGATGAGKTTLLRVLLGLELPLGGEVRFGGAPLEGGAGPASRPFAWVPQDAPLLADTLAANVALGADDADARTALASVGAERLARELGDARLGAGGRAVSGGERQWIALARAIATDLPVLLLDEPTSGLDAEAQAMVLAAIERLRGARTVVIVTHRPEPLAIADAVVALDSARLPAPGGAVFGFRARA